ncbi:polyphosphate kinase 2 family protein [Variovorax dokdonensis]|uniref:Polyphosphate kinase 2 family protein n=1 Tax=Variovorax dokdonensis TaxID=344883 RepID=A0ABT7N873_9BURK|nr:PPK2 family polyphosphate kinase [Variovorax dokdonensis]MDM0044144.1 polyphosphate kinase 2 family protein [Variovorax dokdonensis]
MSNKFKPYRVPTDGDFRLRAIDPNDIPFSEGSEDVDQGNLEAMAKELDKLQNKLHAEGRRKVLLVLQGMDTSGKDGTIRWVFSRTSPLGVRVYAFKAPGEIELSHDYLWRCHAVVPAAGQLMVWNRSHYEDVLVPVVEKWIDRAEAQRRYRQINDFERLLVETGTTVIKCMLHIGQDEQRQRLQERIDEPDKNWKFSRGDLEVRKKWSAYQQAYERALAHTSTEHAPWHVIPSNNKLHRNLMVARLLIKTLKRMDLSFPPADPALKGLVVE